jgi:virulence factor Mce-like protein
MPYVSDSTGRELPAGAFARRGGIALLVVVAVLIVLFLQYKGAFRATFPATALVGDVGDGVNAGADVKLRGVLVGSVRDVGVRVEPGKVPLHALDLDLRPDAARQIPAGVTARVIPVNTFGSPGLELLDPVGANPYGGPRLVRGAIIAGDNSQRTLQLQTVLSELERVLKAIHPAELNVALTNVSQSLQGKGGQVGSLIGASDRYLTVLNGQTETFSTDLKLLGTDLQVFHAAAPGLLDTVDNGAVTAGAIVSTRGRLDATLSQAGSTVDRVDDFLRDNDDDLLRLFANGSEIARLLADQEHDIPRSLGSLGQTTQLLREGLSVGGLNLSGTLTPFTPYTAADCPRYPGLAGPNCTRSGAKDSTPPFERPFRIPRLPVPGGTERSSTDGKADQPSPIPGLMGKW